MDTTGEVITGALITVDAPAIQPAVTPAIRTNSNGEATLSLSPGKHTLSITSRTFKRWTGTIDVDATPRQTIHPVMDIDCAHMICDPVVVSSADPIEPSHASALEINKISQDGPQIPLIVTVVDRSGATIPAAKLEVHRAPSGSALEYEAGPDGIAKLLLGSRTCIVSIRVPGFKVWSRRIDLQRSEDRSIIAVLDIANADSPIAVEPGSGIDIERGYATAQIALEPVLPLAHLPSHKLHE